jgi:hypothetical protein
MDEHGADHVLVIGGPRHGETAPYLGPQMLLPDVPAAAEADSSRDSTAPFAVETPQAMTNYVVRDFYVSGKDTPGRVVRVASPSSMTDDEALDSMARWMEDQASRKARAVSKRAARSARAG